MPSPSVSSAALDRENALLYAEAAVKEYWIILASKRQVEVYRRPENGRFLEVFIANEGVTLECAAVPGIRISIAELFR